MLTIIHIYVYKRFFITKGYLLESGETPVTDAFTSEMRRSLRLAQQAAQMILIRRVKKSHKSTQHNSYPFSMSPYSCSLSE